MRTTDWSHSTDAFLQHASRVGFFLNVPRFIRYVRSPQRSTGGHPLLDVLISATSLWGSRFSNNVSIQARQELLLGNAVQQVADALMIVNTGAPTHDVIAFIQAEVLLANYFFTQDRILEGRYHSSAAISLALSCKLHLQQSIRPRNTDPIPETSALLSGLPPPEDLIQVGERVNAFWTVHTLYKTWAVAMGAPINVWAGEGNFGTQPDLEIPWPLSMDACENVSMVAILILVAPCET